MEKNSVIAILLTAALLLILAVTVSCGKGDKTPDAKGSLYSESAELDEEGYLDPSMAFTDSLDGNAKTGTESATSDSSGLKGYQYTWTDSKEIPPVIIIVDDFGYADGELLQDYADLPREVVFAVLPDLPFSRKSAQIAQRGGHDVIIHAPMEAKAAKIKPGERYLKSGQDADAVRGMIDSFREQMPMAIALNNHMGSTATADTELMRTVLSHLESRGMFFVDSVTSKDTVGYNLANTLGYKSVRRNLFLDVPDNTDATIAARISDLGRFRGRVEPVVVITHCHNRAKLDALKKFIAQIKSMGVKLSSLSGYYGGAVAMR